MNVSQTMEAVYFNMIKKIFQLMKTMIKNSDVRFKVTQGSAGIGSVVKMAGDVSKFGYIGQHLGIRNLAQDARKVGRVEVAIVVGQPSRRVCRSGDNGDVMPAGASICHVEHFLLEVEDEHPACGGYPPRELHRLLAQSWADVLDPLSPTGLQDRAQRAGRARNRHHLAQ